MNDSELSTTAPAQEPAATVQAAPVQPATLPGNFSPLWTTRDVANFLQRSEGWVYSALRADPNKAGSLPSIRIPGGRGSRGEGSARFVSADIMAWVSAGCPPAAIFKTWQDSERKKKKSA